MGKTNRENLENFEKNKSDIYDLIYIAAKFYNELLDINNFLLFKRYNDFSKIIDIEKPIFLGLAVLDHFNGNLKVLIKEKNVHLYIDDKLFNCDTIEDIKTFVYEKLKKDINIRKLVLDSEITSYTKELEELCKGDIKTFK